MSVVLVYVCDVCGTERRDGGASSIEMRASGNAPSYWVAEVRACEATCLEKGYALLPKLAREVQARTGDPPVDSKLRVSKDRY